MSQTWQYRISVPAPGGFNAFIDIELVSLRIDFLTVSASNLWYGFACDGSISMSECLSSSSLSDISMCSVLMIPGSESIFSSKSFGDG